MKSSHVRVQVVVQEVQTTEMNAFLLIKKIKIENTT